MPSGFEWDPQKRESNLEKHGVDFLRAVRIFEGFVHQSQDTRKEYGEVRMNAIGQVDDLTLAVVYRVREEAIRISSARRANRDEEADYRALRSEKT